MRANLTLHAEYHRGEVDRRIFGGFLEHMGRAVYEGVYDPDSPLADDEGFRADVLEAIRRLQMPIMRYPGGNFVSTYDWTDGIGPREQRPARPDYAWKSIEPNVFGTDEFMSWCRKAQTSPMLAVNLGTRGAAEAQALVEYCNMPPGTYWADRRVANGHREPYGVKVWCLGNEMDGPWQAGHVPAREYAMRADQAAKLMKGLDPTIEVVLCGSSGRFMPTYMEWDREALEYCWDLVDYVSAHRYSENRRDDTAWFLAEGLEIERIIEDYAGLFAYVRGRKRSNKRVYLSFDEWNVWYKAMEMDGRWTRAPHLIEEVYNLEDALVCAQYLNAFVRRADVVKIACIAQIVNIIAPLLTKKDGLLVQSIYYPFLMVSSRARGKSLIPLLDCPTYHAGERGEAPVLDVAATLSDANRLAVFAVNRSQSDDLTLQVNLSDATCIGRVTGEALTGPGPKVCNTWDEPQNVVPQSVAGRVLNDGRGLEVTVPRLGFVAVDVEVKRM